MRSHVVFAPSSSDNYASSSFSGLTDLLQAGTTFSQLLKYFIFFQVNIWNDFLVGNQTETQRPKEWAQIKQHLSVISFLIDGAGKSLSDHL